MESRYLKDIISAGKTPNYNDMNLYELNLQRINLEALKAHAGIQAGKTYDRSLALINDVISVRRNAISN